MAGRWPPGPNRPPSVTAGLRSRRRFGVWPSALVEHLLVDAFPASYFLSVATAEETIKLTLVWLLALGLGTYRRRDGMALGAAVGSGFAAFESLGYAFSTVRTAGDIDVVAIVEIQMTRGVIPTSATRCGLLWQQADCSPPLGLRACYTSDRSVHQSLQRPSLTLIQPRSPQAGHFSQAL